MNLSGETSWSGRDSLVDVNADALLKFGRVHEVLEDRGIVIDFRMNDKSGGNETDTCSIRLLDMDYGFLDEYFLPVEYGYVYWQAIGYLDQKTMYYYTILRVDNSIAIDPSGANDWKESYIRIKLDLDDMSNCAVEIMQQIGLITGPFNIATQRWTISNYVEETNTLYWCLREKHYAMSLVTGIQSVVLGVTGQDYHIMSHDAVPGSEIIYSYNTAARTINKVDLEAGTIDIIATRPALPVDWNSITRFFFYRKRGNFLVVCDVDTGLGNCLYEVYDLDGQLIEYEYFRDFVFNQNTTLASSIHINESLTKMYAKSSNGSATRYWATYTNDQSTKDIPLLSGDLEYEYKQFIDLSAVGFDDVNFAHCSVDKKRGFIYKFVTSLSGTIGSGTATAAFRICRYDLDMQNEEIWNTEDTYLLNEFSQDYRQNNQPFYDPISGNFVMPCLIDDTLTPNTTGTGFNSAFALITIDQEDLTNSTMSFLCSNSNKSAPLVTRQIFVLDYDSIGNTLLYYYGQANLNGTNTNLSKIDISTDTLIFTKTGVDILEMNGSHVGGNVDKKRNIINLLVANSFASQSITKLVKVDYETGDFIRESANTIDGFIPQAVNSSMFLPLDNGLFKYTFNSAVGVGIINLPFTVYRMYTAIFNEDLTLINILVDTPNGGGIGVSGRQFVDYVDDEIWGFFNNGADFGKLVSKDKTKNLPLRQSDVDSQIELFKILADPENLEVVDGKVAKVKNLAKYGLDLFQHNTTEQVAYEASPTRITLPIISRFTGISQQHLNTSLRVNMSNGPIWILNLFRQFNANAVDLLSSGTLGSLNGYGDRYGSYQDTLIVYLGQAGTSNVNFVNAIQANPPGDPGQYRFHAIRIENDGSGTCFICKEDGTLFEYSSNSLNHLPPLNEELIYSNLFQSGENGHSPGIREYQLIQLPNKTLQQEYDEVNARMTAMAAGTGFTWTNITL